MAKKYKRKDHLYNEAKAKGLRSRAFYKLQELDKKHRLIKRGSKILDLGAWPGSWIQYCQSKLGESGKIYGIDLQEIEEFDSPAVKLAVADVFSDEAVGAATDFLGGKCDLVLSDLSPKLTGIKDCDQAAMCALLERVLWWCESLLKVDGVFVAKAFKGQDTDQLIKSMKSRCKRVVREELKSTRKTSQEFYIVGWLQGK